MSHHLSMQPFQAQQSYQHLDCNIHFTAPHISPGWREAIEVKCLAQGHNALATAGLEPVTYRSRALFSTHWATRALIGFIFCLGGQNTFIQVKSHNFTPRGDTLQMIAMTATLVCTGSNPRQKPERAPAILFYSVEESQEWLYLNNYTLGYT